MKRAIVFVALLGILWFIPGMDPVSGVPVFQDDQEEVIPTQDSVSIDDLDPVFYEATEDDSVLAEESAGSTRLIVGVVGIVLLLGIGYIFLTRARKKE